MTRPKKPDSGKPSKSWASGTSRSRPIDPHETRSQRLRRRRQAAGSFYLQDPRIDRGAEVRTLIVLAAAVLLGAAGLAAVVITGAYGPESGLRSIFSFSIGLTGACLLASGLTFMITLRHKLLLVAGAALLVAAGAIVLGVAPLESLAKIVFATSTGLWISLILTSVPQLLLIAGLIIAVDFYSVFLGPTRKMVESGGPWLDYLTINLPVFFVDASSRLGVSDIIFFAVFTGCALTFRLRRVLTAAAMAASFVGTMVIGVTLETGVPALPLLSLAFLLVNADLFHRRYVQDTGGPAEPEAGDGGRDRAD